MSDASIALHKKYEGFRRFVYDDANDQPVVPGYTLIGHPTVGWGRCLDTHGILEAEADVMCANNDLDATADLQGIFVSKWAALGPVRQAALIDMRFALGGAGFREFHVMVTALLNQKWTYAARALLDSKWARQVGQRAKDLAQMVETGVAL